MFSALVAARSLASCLLPPASLATALPQRRRSQRKLGLWSLPPVRVRVSPTLQPMLSAASRSRCREPIFEPPPPACFLHALGTACPWLPLPRFAALSIPRLPPPGTSSVLGAIRRRPCVPASLPAALGQLRLTPGSLPCKTPTWSDAGISGGVRDQTRATPSVVINLCRYRKLQLAVRSWIRRGRTHQVNCKLVLWRLGDSFLGVAPWRGLRVWALPSANF